MVVALVVYGVFGFGLLVVGAIVVGRIRDRRRWSETSQVSVTPGVDYEDPAAGGSTAGAEVNTTDAWVIGQTQARVTDIRTSGMSGFGSL
jgi:hypothetical protein